MENGFDSLLQYFRPKHTLMDETMALRNMTQYAVLCGPDGKPMPNASQIILNYPRVFGDAMVSMLNADNRGLEVTRTENRKQKEIEQWYEDNFYDNDMWLSEQVRESLEAHFNFDICYRGIIECLPLIEYDQDTQLYRFRAIPYSPRSGVWKIGQRGVELSWNWIRLNKAATEKKYNASLKGKETDALVGVKWDTERYYLYEMVNGSIAPDADPFFSVEHNLKKCPMRIEPCPLAPEQITSGSNAGEDLKEWGPDIYAPVIKTIKYMNEFVSVLATVHRQQFETPLQVEGGEGMDLSGVTFHGWGTVIPTPTGVKIVPIAQPGVSSGMENLFYEMFKSFEMATLSSVNYGQAGDRQSALAILNLKSDNAKQLKPRRQAKQTMMRKVCEDFRRQIANGTFFATEIKQDDEYAFTAEKINKELFEKKFTIAVNYESIKPQEDIALGQLAMQFKSQGIMDDEEIQRNIMHRKDPAGAVRKIRLQQLKEITPAASIAEGIIAIEDDPDMDADIKLLMKDILMKQLRDIAAQMSTPPMPTPGNQGSPPNIVESTAQANSNKLASNAQKRQGQQAVVEANRQRR
jgi:hypothetical protein